MEKVYPPPPFMGKNTRRLFQGVKTHKGYLKRVGAAPSTESNGCMMRCIPLLWTTEGDLEEDVRITNDNDVCVEACLALWKIFRGLRLGEDPLECLTQTASETVHPDVQRAILDGQAHIPRDLGTSKGWVVHPLYVLALVLSEYGPTIKAMRATLVALNSTYRGSDSDTIGAIVLGVLGGVIGRERLLKSAFFLKAYETVVTADSSEGDAPRPAIYQPSGKGLGGPSESFDELVEEFVKVVGSG
jgi:ADP-ribosylglycohydrolase